MKFPKERYKFIHIPHIGKVIAISSYAGKPVSACATCDPKDTYDQETGEELAAVRCNLKVAKKRFSRATNELEEAKDEMIRAISKYDKMIAYESDARRRLQEAKKDLIEIEERLK